MKTLAPAAEQKIPTRRRSFRLVALGRSPPDAAFGGVTFGDRVRSWNGQPIVRAVRRTKSLEQAYTIYTR